MNMKMEVHVQSQSKATTHHHQGNVKLQKSKRPEVVDISVEPYDKHVKVLMRWKQESHQTIISTIQSLTKYKYSCLSEVMVIFEQVSKFHKEICKENQRSDEDELRVQVCEQYFEGIIELKKKLKKLQKDNSFQKEKEIKKNILNNKYQKINFVNTKPNVPSELLQQELDPFHKNQLGDLYCSFVAYYPQSHNDRQTNTKLISFLKTLYHGLKKRYFYLKQKDYFMGVLDDICRKFKDEKFLLNKKKMLNGEISPDDIIRKRTHAFINYELKKKDQQEFLRVLKDSQIKMASNQNKDEEQAVQSSSQSEYNENDEERNKSDDNASFSNLNRQQQSKQSEEVQGHQEKEYNQTEKTQNQQQKDSTAIVSSVFNFNKTFMSQLRSLFKRNRLIN